MRASLSHATDSQSIHNFDGEAAADILARHKTLIFEG